MPESAAEKLIGFKIPRQDNILEPDPVMEALATIDDGIPRAIVPTDLLRAIETVELDDPVPLEVRRAFQMALGAFAYSYWYYPLTTLATQQLLRVADFALDRFAQVAGLSRREPLKLRIQHLAELGFLTTTEQARWNRIRLLRNDATHPEFQQTWSMGQAVSISQTIAQLISALPWDTSTSASRRLGFLVPLTYSEFFGTSPTRAMLEDFVAQMHWKYVVKLSAGIAAISWQFGVEDPHHQLQLVASYTGRLLYGPALITRLKTDSTAILFSRESLFALLRLAVVSGYDGKAEEATYPDLFTKSALMANEMLGGEVTPADFTQSASDLLASELRSRPLHLDNPHDLLARTDAFLRWSESDQAKRSTNYIHIEEDFVRFTGLTSLEYAAGAYIILARCAAMQTWNDVERMGVAFDFEEWQHGVADTRVPRQWLAINSIPVTELRRAWKDESSLSFAAAGPLWSKPVVQSEEGLYFVPSPALVMNKLGDGMYFALFDAYRSDGPEAHLKFSRFWSEFFEAYVAERFLAGYSARPDVIAMREQEYRRGIKSSDVIVCENEDILLIEVVAKRPNLLRSVLHLDDLAIAQDLEAGITGKLRQLHRNVQAFRARTLLPDVPRHQGQRIFPIIVAPQEWPRVNVISQLVEQLKHSDALLADTEPVELLDIGEVEWLEHGFRAGLRFGELLSRKNRSTQHNRFQSLHNYILNVEPHAIPEGITPTRRHGSEVAQRVIKLAEAWVSQPDE